MTSGEIFITDHLDLFKRERKKRKKERKKERKRKEENKMKERKKMKEKVKNLVIDNCLSTQFTSILSA